MVSVFKIPPRGFRIRFSRDTFASVSRSTDAKTVADFEVGCKNCDRKPISAQFFWITAVGTALIALSTSIFVSFQFGIKTSFKTIDVSKVHFLTETYVPLLLLFFLVLPLALTAVPAPVYKKQIDNTIAAKPMSLDLSAISFEFYPAYEKLSFSTPFLSNNVTEDRATQMCSRPEICIGLSGKRQHCPGEFTGIVMTEKISKKFQLPWFAIGSVLLCGAPKFKCPKIGGCLTRLAQRNSHKNKRQTMTCKPTSCPDTVKKFLS